MIRGYDAICPRTGAVLRPATELEAAAYRAQVVPHPSGVWAFRRALRVGAVLVDEDTGPGASHVPGRFL